MEVIECDRTDERFVQLKNTIYSDSPYPPMPEPHPENLLKCFLVLEAGNPVARAALYGNCEMLLDGKKVAQVGSFEAFNNEAATVVLFEAIANYACKAGFDTLVGPMNGSTWHPYRFNCKEEEPFFTEYIHPDYYNRLWGRAGFKKLTGYYSSLSEGLQQMEIPETALPPDLTLRTLNLDKYEAELEKIHRFCMEAFADNFLFTSLSEVRFKALYIPLEKWIDPRLVVLAEYKGELAGLIFCLPDHHYKTEQRAIIKTLARKPGKFYRGLGYVLTAALYKQAKALNYQSIIHAFMMDEGNAKSVSGAFYGKPFREYILYQKDLKRSEKLNG